MVSKNVSRGLLGGYGLPMPAKCARERFRGKRPHTWASHHVPGSV